MAASSSKSPSRGARIAAVLVLGFFGLFVFAQGSSDSTAPGNAANPAGSGALPDPDTIAPLATPPPADLTALLDGLSLGNEFEGWKVVNFLPTKERIVWIEFGKDGTFFSVGLGAKGTGKPLPPIQTEQYEVGYGMMRPKEAAIPQDVQTRIAEQVATRIRKREKEVAKPAAL